MTASTPTTVSPFEREDRAEHAVRRRVLRPHVHGQPLGCRCSRVLRRDVSASRGPRLPVRRMRRVDRVGLQERMALPVVGQQDAAQIGMAVEPHAEHVVALALHPVRRRGTPARATGTPSCPAPSRVRICTDSRSSRLSTHAITSRPSAFQSIAVEKRKEAATERVLRELRDRRPLLERHARP